MVEAFRVSHSLDRLHPTVVPILHRTLRVVGDNSMALYNRASTQGYEECQGDILTVSEMAEDIRDALLEYQVSCEIFHAAEIVELTLGCFDRQPSNGQYMIRTAG